jgi:hypothetical protein
MKPENPETQDNERRRQVVFGRFAVTGIVSGERYSFFRGSTTLRRERRES